MLAVNLWPESVTCTREGRLKLLLELPPLPRQMEPTKLPPDWPKTRARAQGVSPGTCPALRTEGTPTLSSLGSLSLDFR